MGKSQPMLINGVTFDNKTKAKAFMKDLLGKLEIGEEIKEGQGDIGSQQVFPWFKYLFENYHYRISDRGYTVTGMRKFPYLGHNTGYELHVFINELGTWTDASYIKCFKTTTWESHFKTALRDYFKQELRPLAEDPEICMVSGCDITSKLDYQHHDPTFRAMVEDILPIFTEEEKKEMFGFSWETQAKFSIPNDHKSIVRLGELHDGSLYAWLCKSHHYQTFKDEFTLQYETLELRL
jgi:hypothetical protein